MSSFLNILFHVLVLVPSLINAQAPTLTLDYYQKTCPDFNKIVLQTVTARQKQHPGTAAGMLRLFFHDCFTKGCDASILIATKATTKVERQAVNNLSISPEAFDTIDIVKDALEAACPGVVSCSDILAQTTRDFVTMLGGPSYEVKLGRKDGLVSLASNVDGKLPIPSHTVQEMSTMFKSNGFTLKELVVLSGAHTVGICHCVHFANRVFGAKADPELDPKFNAELKEQCKGYEADQKKTTFLDSVTPTKFDNMYFKNLERGLGLLASDHVLFKDPSTKPIVEQYAKDEALFFEDFSLAMEKLSVFGIKGEKDGEVRRKCDLFNSDKL